MKYIGISLMTIALILVLITLIQPWVVPLKIGKKNRKINILLIVTAVIFIAGVVVFVIEERDNKRT